MKKYHIITKDIFDVIYKYYRKSYVDSICQYYYWVPQGKLAFRLSPELTIKFYAKDVVDNSTREFIVIDVNIPHFYAKDYADALDRIVHNVKYSIERIRKCIEEQGNKVVID